MSLQDYTYDNGEQVPEFQCYACHYRIKKKEVMGTANCDDPFNKHDVNTVPCHSYCAVSSYNYVSASVSV